MKADSLLLAIEIGWWVVALGLPILLLAAIRLPRKWRWRVPAVVLVSWSALVLYTSEVYFPTGVAHATQLGIDNPYQGFDNNNFVPVLVLGWLLPLTACTIAAFGRLALQKHRGGKE
ncbi:hypothetical protein OVA13_12890 [Pseudoxanthomonas sp. SL93]|uniref:hypothetical protein n=1 Tax=Pseudoxanthomonas sp. SL93 TaxID=2995142 RepID=UPI00226FCE41|nr:hypothetical protein [Pseudoxanthomonas sp. SL93]WAC62281.1 hypothetical protein OVA13_12890 [Pseudoxanthomonas sp. SL93]